MFAHWNQYVLFIYRMAKQCIWSVLLSAIWLDYILIYLTCTLHWIKATATQTNASVTLMSLCVSAGSARPSAPSSRTKLIWLLMDPVEIPHPASPARRALWSAARQVDIRTHIMLHTSVRLEFFSLSTAASFCPLLAKWWNCSCLVVWFALFIQTFDKQNSYKKDDFLSFLKFCLRVWS